jgi:cysteine sulfinate desulfinase/cysteine desulfurase-like protein
MGIGDTEALGSVRVSLGRATSLKDVELGASELASAWRRTSSSETERLMVNAVPSR